MKKDVNEKIGRLVARGSLNCNKVSAMDTQTLAYTWLHQEYELSNHSIVLQENNATTGKMSMQCIKSRES